MKNLSPISLFQHPNSFWVKLRAILELLVLVVTAFSSSLAVTLSATMDNLALTVLALMAQHEKEVTELTNLRMVDFNSSKELVVKNLISIVDFFEKSFCSSLEALKDVFVAFTERLTRAISVTLQRIFVVLTLSFLSFDLILSALWSRITRLLGNRSLNIFHNNLLFSLILQISIFLRCQLHDSKNQIKARFFLLNNLIRSANNFLIFS